MNQGFASPTNVGVKDVLFKHAFGVNGAFLYRPDKRITFPLAEPATHPIVVSLSGTANPAADHALSANEPTQLPHSLIDAASLPPCARPCTALHGCDSAHWPLPLQCKACLCGFSPRTYDLDASAFPSVFNLGRRQPMTRAAYWSGAKLSLPHGASRPIPCAPEAYRRWTRWNAPSCPALGHNRLQQFRLGVSRDSLLRRPAAVRGIPRLAHDRPAIAPQRAHRAQWLDPGRREGQVSVPVGARGGGAQAQAAGKQGELRQADRRRDPVLGRCQSSVEDDR